MGFNETHSLHLPLNWTSTQKMQNTIQIWSLVNWANYIIDYPLTLFFFQIQIIQLMLAHIKIVNKRLKSVWLINFLNIIMYYFTSNKDISRNFALSLNTLFFTISRNFVLLRTNVFKTGPVIKQKKLLVHDSFVESAIEPRSNRWHHRYIFYILLKLINNLLLNRIFI